MALPITPTDLLIGALRAARIPTGDAEAKDDKLAPLVGRFVVVYQVAEQTPDGPVSDTSVDRTVDLQVTACGPSRQAVDLTAEKARTVALAVTDGPPPTGRSWLADAEHIVGAPVTRATPSDPDRPAETGWYRADLYRYRTTPR
ncbi:hypothetical protein ACN20G_28170 (plasmid) [Streptomyces sp. BI20]|uniref:hypothetical protein n=1 Tax=Streptomyces sp. BI20 TaxID=3403460 RepID=UPI003C7180B8